MTIAAGFANAFTATSTSVGSPGASAGAVTVSAQNGSVTLQPQ